VTARDVIAQALALSEAATDGPWVASLNDDDSDYAVWADDAGSDIILAEREADALLAAAARTLLPAFAKALGDVLDMHSEIERFEADPANGTWLYDENGEKRPLPSICRHCTPDDTLLEVEECNWDDGMETVRYPCPTRAAITAALSEVTP